MSRTDALSKEELTWIYTALCHYAWGTFQYLNENSKKEVRALTKKIRMKRDDKGGSDLMAIYLRKADQFKREMETLGVKVEVTASLGRYTSEIVETALEERSPE